MSINKRALLLPAVAITSLVINIILISKNCNQKDSAETTVTNRHRETPAQPAPHKRVTVPENLSCTDDEDCPEDKFCENSRCMTLEELESEYVDAGVADTEDADVVSGPRSCESQADCGCGYECKYNECHSIDSACNVNGDCKTGDFCNREYDQVCGTCTKSECEYDADCKDNGCGWYCFRNTCVQYGCCNNSDCSSDEFCQLIDGSREGRCKQIECYSDYDCGTCGFICDQTSKSCLDTSEDRPIPCCGGYIYYKEYSRCVPQYLTEDGNCIDSSHCKKGEVCNTDENNCYPESCKENAECGFQAVCRKGHCEHGCDDDSNCNDEYPTCDRGECVNLDEEEEE